MAINDDLITKLNSNDYQLALSSLKTIINKNKINDNDILIILNLENKLIINEFFNLQPKFSESNLLITENFINDNLFHKNKLFVSDLIEIAIDFNLNLNYKKCILLLLKYKADNHYVLMSSMEYLFSNLKMNYVPEIINHFSNILNNKEIEMPARLKAAFYMYRITYKEKYWIKLKKYSENDLYNKEILKNLIKINANKKIYFEGYPKILELCRRSE